MTRKSPINVVVYTLESIAEAKLLIAQGKPTVLAGQLLFVNGRGYGQPVLDALVKQNVIDLSGPKAITRMPLVSSFNN